MNKLVWGGMLFMVGCSQPLPGGAFKTAVWAWPSDPDFKAFDLDGNHLLSLREYVQGKWSQIRFFKAPTDQEVRHMKAGFARDFARADLTHDGWLNPYEYCYANEPPAERGRQARLAMERLTLR